MWLDSLPFFDERHRLVIDSATDDPRESRARLAARLLASGRRPRARHFARRKRDAQAALECAAAALHEVLAREAGAFNAQAEALWPEVHGAWNELAHTETAALALATTVRDLGIEEPAGAREVLRAAATDLLPSVHAILHAQLLSTEPSAHQAFHLRALRETASREGVDPEIVQAMVGEHVAAARAAHGAGDTKGAMELYRTALEALADGARRAHLGSEAVATGRAWAFAEEKPPTLKRREHCAMAAALAQTLPADFSLARLRAGLEMREGVALISELNQFNDGALCFARAAVLDPLSPDPDELLKATREALAKQGDAVRSVLKAGRQLNATGHALLKEANANLEAAAGFADSEEGRSLRGEVARAIFEQVCIRLRLDPRSDVAPGALAGLLEALSSFDSTAQSFADLRARVTARHAELAGAPWELVEAVRAKFDRVSAALLAEVLPAPSFDLDEDVRRVLVDASAVPAAAGAGTGPRPARFDLWIFWPWLFSSRDVVAKLAAVAGAALLLAAGGSDAWRRWNDHNRDGAYARFQAAQAAADQPAAMAAANDFLAHVQPGLADYRIDPVRTEYAQRLLAEMARAAKSGDDQRLSALQRDARLLPRDDAPVAP